MTDRYDVDDLDIVKGLFKTLTADAISAEEKSDAHHFIEVPESVIRMRAILRTVFIPRYCTEYFFILKIFLNYESEVIVMGLIPFNSEGQWDEIKAEVKRKRETISKEHPEYVCRIGCGDVAAQAMHADIVIEPIESAAGVWQ